VFRVETFSLEFLNSLKTRPRHVEVRG